MKNKQNTQKNTSLERLLIISMVIFMLIPTLNASLGTYKQSSCVQIKTILNSSLVNISSLSYPNSSIAVTEQPMTKVGSTFNYTFCETTELGTYIYDYNDEVGNVYVNDFEITPSGRVSSTGESILYFVFVIVIFGLLLLMFYFILSMPKGNEEDERGGIKIVRMKYLRIFLIAIIYPIIMILLNLMNGLAVNFTTLSIFSGTIGFLFEVMLRGAWVWTIIMAGWVIISLIKDSNVKKNMQRIGRKFR